jgi:hypothetical protein
MVANSKAQFLVQQNFYKLDVRGSVHHSTIHKEKSNKMMGGVSPETC